MHRDPRSRDLQQLLPADLRDDVAAMAVDGEILLLDPNREEAIRLDTDAVARLRSDGAARADVLDALGQLGLRAAHDTGVMSRRRLIAAGAAVGITVLALPSAAAAASATTTTTSSLPTVTFDTTINVGSIPNMLAFSVGGTTLYVANYDGNSVNLIDVGGGYVSGSINYLFGPWAPACTNSYLYITNNLAVPGSVTLKDANTLDDLGTIVVGPSPTAAVVKSDLTRLYVVNNGPGAGGNSVTVINTTDNSFVTTVSVGLRPYGAVVTPDGSSLYVTNYGNADGNTVSVIDTGTNAVTATIAVDTGPMNPAVTPNGKRVYVPNYWASTVSVIDTDPLSGTYHSVIDTLAGLTTAHDVAVTPNGKVAFVSLATANEVKVIDVDPLSATYHQVIDTLTGLTSPYGLAVHPTGTRLYVANAGNNTVSVFTIA